MNILKMLRIGSKTQKQELNSSEETCPVCWGHQQYDGKIRILYEDKERDYKNNKKPFVRSLQLQKDIIDGHRIKKGEIIECPTCGRKNKK